MCIGTPLRIVAVDGIVGTAEDAAGARVAVDLSLLPEVGPGDWVLDFLGAARRRLEEEEALQIRAALDALAAAMNGGSFEDGFADLIDREPTLPPHLEAARAAGLTEA
ncbi:HypC/HybG/HupF family hydrogenase formation chaperone [Azospirillum thermophilum]|uniref:Hydrogenase n=1 Tax=Azospirillum thermophilum TaxID=2202148 RepID=A0A2S2CYW9_9PROT|nr:HypC/HybG/HupF family hydrogenase formation chaperone [Azospirillum thermophilum]AWK89712.1 hydrogenase [Azospirillum thermophilum]